MILNEIISLTNELKTLTESIKERPLIAGHSAFLSDEEYKIYKKYKNKKIDSRELTNGSIAIDLKDLLVKMSPIKSHAPLNAKIRISFNGDLFVDKQRICRNTLGGIYTLDTIFNKIHDAVDNMLAPEQQTKIYALQTEALKVIKLIGHHKKKRRDADLLIVESGGEAVSFEIITDVSNLNLIGRLLYNGDDEIVLELWLDGIRNKHNNDIHSRYGNKGYRLLLLSDLKLTVIERILSQFERLVKKG